MFVVVGRFRFRPLRQEERQSLLQGIQNDLAPIVRDCSGFRGVTFARPGEDEMMAIWQWDSAADWDAAMARFAPYLQQQVIPNLAGPPERVGAEVVTQIMP
jgi:hypothetical protein